MRVVIAMSGGVDSSVAASLLVDAGHEVIGLSMQLYDQRGGEAGFGSCCTIDDLHDARRVADHLGIPHYIVNLERQFEETVVADFVREYAAGRTPLPCAHCNSELKFAELTERALGLGAEAVATGHYARVDRDSDGGRFHLRRGLDPSKDQSYFLFALTQAQLSRALFPLGAWLKEDARRYARDKGLRVADKRDSQELCFVPDGDYARFVASRLPSLERPGLVRDRDGRVLGRHEGTHRFTIGQRKGIGLSAREPLYVTAIDASTNTVVVGPHEALERRRLDARRVNWTRDEPPAGPVALAAQIRHRHPAARARVTPIDEARASVEFEEPQHGVTPGQAVVFYEGDEVVGGGWID